MMYWGTSSMPECLWRLSPHLGYCLVAELRLHCRCTAIMVKEMSVRRHDVLVDIFEVRMFVAAFSAPRLRLVAELRLHCRCTALHGEGNVSKMA